MKGLSKGSFDKIKVYRYLSIASNAKHSSNYKSKFRELVMRVIREARATSENMSEFGNANEDLLIEEEPNEDHLQVENTREASKRRTTSAAIERNFQEIEELNAESTFYLQNYTCMLELRDKPSREQHEADKHYKKYLYKKHRLEDRLIVAGLCIISMSFLAICAGRGNCSILEITLRSGQVLLEVIAFVLAGYSIGRLWICIFMILANIFILLVDKLACWQLSGGTNLFGSLVNPSFTSLSHFSVMLSITVFSGVVGLRFLHMCLVGMSALLVNAVLAGLGSVSINNFYELMYIVCVLVRKYETQKESIINFHQRVKL